MLADLMIAGLAAPGLLEHQLQAGGQLFPAGGDVGQGIAPRVGQYFQALYAQYRIDVYKRQAYFTSAAVPP